MANPGSQTRRLLAGRRRKEKKRGKEVRAQTGWDIFTIEKQLHGKGDIGGLQSDCSRKKIRPGVSLKRGRGFISPLTDMK